MKLLDEAMRKYGVEVVLYLLGAAVLFSLLIAAQLVYAADADVTSAQEIPKDPPVSAVAVIQCNYAIALVATMADGSVVVFDATSKPKFEDEKAWIERAARVITIEAKCAISPGAADT